MNQPLGPNPTDAEIEAYVDQRDKLLNRLAVTPAGSLADVLAKMSELVEEMKLDELEPMQTRLADSILQDLKRLSN